MGDVTTSALPLLVSTDDHVVEPPHLYERWLPAKWRDVGPRVERRRVRGFGLADGSISGIQGLDDPDGTWCDMWVFEGKLAPQRRSVAAVGFDREDMNMSPITYDEMRPGCWQVKPRVEDMLANHVDKSLCFPTFPRFCGQTSYDAADRELGLACIHAYNDFMIEEWCGESAGHLVPLCLVPLWDAELAAATVRQNAARGCHAVSFSEIPPRLGLPSIHSGYWDPLFAACAQTGTTVCMHIGSSSTMPFTSSDAPGAVEVVSQFENVASSLCDFLFSGVLVRFPELHLAYSEGQIGWIPYVLERSDDVWHEHRGWAMGNVKIPEPPSTYYYRQVFGCFFRDRLGVQLLGKVGEDNVTFETDYPHTDTSWPNTRALAEEMFAGLDPLQTWKVARGNAIRMLHLEPETPPV